MSEKSNTARVQLSWSRRQWLKFVALLGDHPVGSTLAFAASGGLLLFYATCLGGISHFLESGARWRMETFGGGHRVNRSVRTPDVLLSLKHPAYDRLDAIVPSAMHFGGTAFQPELKQIVAQDAGLVRICALDPRLADPAHPSHLRFVALAEAFGMNPSEFCARCWYSAAVLLQLERDFGDGIQIRLITAPAASARYPYFSDARSGHVYLSENPNKRLDIIVPRPDEPTFSVSFTNPGVIFKNRPDDAEVIRSRDDFLSTWESATPLDRALQSEFQKHLDGQNSSKP